MFVCQKQKAEEIDPADVQIRYPFGERRNDE